MLRNHFGAFAALLIAGAVTLAGCASSGEGGGGGGGSGDSTTPPTLTGNTYYMPVENSDGTMELDVTLSTAQWIATERAGGTSLWGDVVHTASGFLRLVPTGNTTTGPPPTALYAVEIPTGFLFLVTSDDGIPDHPGGYERIQVGFDMHGAAPTVGQRFNFVRVGEGTFNQLSDVAFGALTVSANGGGGLDFSGMGTSIGNPYGGDPVISSEGLVFTGGDGLNSTTEDKIHLTASGIGPLDFGPGQGSVGYILVPETAIASSDIVAAGRTYLGFGQVPGNPAVADLYTLLFQARGTGTSLEGQPVINPDAVEGYPSSDMGTVHLAVSGTSPPAGMFDNATFDHGAMTNLAVRVMATTVNSKIVLVLMTQCDNDNDLAVATPGDWIFMVLIEQ